MTRPRPADPQHQHDSRPHYPTSKQVRIRTEEIILDVALAVLIAIFIGWLHTRMEGGSFMRWAEYSTQEWIQHVLAAHPASKDVPIVLVDISSIEVAPIPGAQHSEEATPRKPLENLLQTLASNNPPPRAIGIDIDFAPQETYRTPQDPGFFDFCLKLKQQTHVPIYLGVFGTQVRPFDQWLLNPKYKELGASILAPRFQTESMVKCFQVHAQSECGPSMSDALSRQLKPPPPHFVAEHPGYFEKLSNQQLSNNVSLGIFPVDFGAINLLMSRDHTIPSVDPAVIHTYADKIANSVVLVGDVASPSGSDVFRVLGRNDLIPGIYIHAAAIYTLAQAPLYEFTPFARSVMDLVAFVLPTALVMWLRWRYATKPNQFDTHRINKAWTYLTAAITALFGIGVVHLTRLLWPDFLIGIAFSLLELRLEPYLFKAFHWVWHQGPTGPNTSWSTMKNNQACTYRSHAIRRRVFFSALCCCAFADTLFVTSAVADDHVGWIESIHCNAQLRKDPNAQPVDLDPGRDQGMLLYPGQAVRCKSPAKDGDQIEIQDHADLLKQTSKDGWHELKHQEFASTEDEKAVQAFGRTAGRPRGPAAPVFSPADGSAARVEDFTIRWTPTALPPAPRFSLQDASGRELLVTGAAPISNEPSHTAAASGAASASNESAAIRGVLAKTQQDADPTPLTLETHTASGAPVVIHFSLISMGDEAHLAVDLLRCDLKSGLMRFACREYAFTSRNLWNDAANEYDRALETYPQSRQILAIDLALHEQIGDTARASTLRAQLASLPPASDH